MRPERRTGPGVTTPRTRLNVAIPHDTDSGRLPRAGVVVALDSRRRCWRCGVPYASTTISDLGRCQQLALGGLQRGTGTVGPS